MPNTGLLIWGASGHAAVIADALRACGHHVAGFIDDTNPLRAGEAFCEATVLGGVEALATAFERGVRLYVIGFGSIAERLRAATVAEAAGLEPIAVIHPRAIVSTTASVGAGSFIAAGAIIAPGARIGRHCIVNTAASVDHDCVVGEAAHLCPGVRLGGSVLVGRSAWVGIGSTVIEKIVIGEGTVVGAGAVVVEDLPPGVLAFGNPARIIRMLENNVS